MTGRKQRFFQIRLFPMNGMQFQMKEYDFYLECIRGVQITHSEAKIRYWMKHEMGKAFLEETEFVLNAELDKQ